MKTKYFYCFFIALGLGLFSSQNVKAQLSYQVNPNNVQQIRSLISSTGIETIELIEIDLTEEGKQVSVASPNSLTTIYFEDKDGDGYTSGETIEDVPGLDIPGYKEIMFFNPGSISTNYHSGGLFIVFDCDDNDPNTIRGGYYYEDKDGDGYITNSPPLIACEMPEGYISEETIKGIDCDDTSFNTEKPTTTYYFDKDGDGFPSFSGEYCERPSGYKTADELVSTAPDCNDDNKDTWDGLTYYQDFDGDGYITYSSVVCLGAAGPQRDAVIKSIEDAGYNYGFPIKGFDCDDTDPRVGAYKPISFIKTILAPISIQGCSTDVVDNGTRPAFSTEYTTTTLEVLLATGAVLGEGYCSVKRVRYLDYLLPTNVKEPNAINFRRRFLAVDQYDNSAIFERVYTIRDQFKPNIKPIASLTLNNDPGTCGTKKENVNLINPLAGDNCTPISELTFSNNAPEIYNIGENLVEWTVTDKSGNFQKEIQKVIIIDGEIPDVKTKNITLPLGFLGTTTITPELIDGGTTDNCSFSFKDFKLSLSCENLGENLITLTAKDEAGNESSAIAIVTLIDDSAPSFILFPENISVSCGSIPEVITPSTFDNCNSGVVVSFSESSSQDSDISAPGHYNYTLIRTWKATDPSGNTNEKSQTITVSDQLAPNIEALKNLEAKCGSIPEAITPGVKDNCYPNPSVTFSESSDQNPDNSTPGHYSYTITRKWTAKDVAGNQSERTQLIFVTDDRSPEWVTGKEEMDITIYCGAESELEKVQSFIPEALDNCDPNPLISKTSGPFIPGTLPGSGTYTNSFIATDAAGNPSTEIKQFITLIPLSVDASASSRPVEVGLPAVLSATVSPQVSGVEIYFKVINESGLAVFQEKAVTNDSGLAQTTVSDLLVGGYEIVATVGKGCSESVAYMPVFDPNGKFVIGAGWIYSPPGAVMDQPEVEGKANFGFVSKYKKGSNQLDGDTKFRFNAADLTFESTSHEAGTLVISGKKANYRGEGMLNNLPGYKFTITAIDGQWNGQNDSDQFRIKIWGSTGVVYDNQKGADDYSEASTVLGGGSISINEAIGKNKRIENSMLTVSWGTPLETIQDKLNQFSEGWFEGDKLKVKFSAEAYNPLIPGIYQFYGNLSENEGYELDVPVLATVLVLEKPKALDIELSNNLISRDIKPGSIIGVFKTIDPADDQHTYSLSEHPDVELIDDQLVWKTINSPIQEINLIITSTDRAGQMISKMVKLSREILQNEFLLYPNPAESEANVLVQLNEGAIVSIQLFDSSGKLIVSNTAFQKETFIQSFNLDGLAPGIFTIQVKIGYIVMTKRLIKK